MDKRPQPSELSWAGAACAVVVAHPDDETLWAGGTMLLHPEADWTVVALCRGGDADRAPRFYRAMERIGAGGAMGDLDDGPEQKPMDLGGVRDTVAGLLPPRHFDLVLTHSPLGEYTRHRRHEETGLAVLELWAAGGIDSTRLWQFAYEDNHRQYLPRAAPDADVVFTLPDEIWRTKYSIMTVIYGFAPDSFEAETTPRREAFRRAVRMGTLKENNQ